MRRSTAVATIIAVTAGTALSRPVSAQAPDKLQVCGTTTEDMTNIFYGLKTGLFTKERLDVELIPTATGAAATTAVIAGSYDIAKTSTLVVFAAYLHDIPIVIVAPELLNEPRRPFAMLQVAPDSTIKTGADLNGKTIGVTALNDLNTLATRAWVDKNGGDWKSLKFVEIPNAATEAAIAQHRVDAAVLQSPQLDASLSAGTTKSIGDAWSAIVPNFMVGIYVARKPWAEQHGDVLRRFNRAYADATRYVNTHPAETASYAADLTKIEPAKMATMRRSQSGTSITPAMLQPVIDAGVKYETLPHGFPARDLFWSGLT
jgi:NitT/TauT family transport system substrate-binding protein